MALMYPRLQAWLWGVITGAAMAYGVVLVLGMLVGCVDAVERHIDPDRSRCEIEASLRGAECAKVYAFAEPADNPLGHVELCVPERYLDEAQHRHGVAWPSDDERFSRLREIGIDAPCFWICPGVMGCNAFSGCYCP